MRRRARGARGELHLWVSCVYAHLFIDSHGLGECALVPGHFCHGALDLYRLQGRALL